MKTDDCKILYLSPGYFHAREELFMFLSRRFTFRVVDVSHKLKNGVPSADYLETVDNAIWSFPSAKLAKLGMRNVPGLVRAVWKELARGKYDLVISSTQHTLPSKIVSHLRPLFGYKLALVSEVWQYPELSSVAQKLYRRWSTRVLREADYVFCQGTRSSRFAAELGCRESRIMLWPMMSEDLSVKPRVGSGPLRQCFAAHGERVKIGYVGRFVEEKGLIELCEAFKAVRDRASLFLVGAGALGDSLQELSSGDDAITVIPWVTPEDLPYLYSELDVFVLPSHYDGFSTVCSEAASMSLPLIVTDQVGCAPDLVEEGLNGYVVSASDAEELAKALSDLVDRGQEGLRRAGELSRKKFEAMSYHVHHDTLQRIIGEMHETSQTSVHRRVLPVHDRRG
jgi:glycosyltransferase involved in cell wall biosynthesis